VARILLGVSGGIAAYKALELVRLATAAGHAVRVVQTPTSLSFVGRASFEAVTGSPVLVDEFERDPARGAYPGEPPLDHDAISHLELARRAEVFCIAPASANTIAKLAGGLADNLLTSAALACPAPLVVAPAMNNHMYEHPATRANMELLRARGTAIVEPGRGPLASRGEWGVGRLAEPASILAAVEAELLPLSQGVAGGALDGLRVLVTAGGTREPIDPVRFIGNRSTGKMGVALAEAALARGARVTLVAGMVSVALPAAADVIRVETTAQMRDVVVDLVDRADVLVMAAAVADFRPRRTATTKLTRDEGLTLELEPTEDILAAAAAASRAPGARRPRTILVGFAAETGSLERAADKLRRKGVDFLVANDVSEAGSGFGTDTNRVTILVPDAPDQPLPLLSKRAAADAILDRVASALDERDGAGQTESMRQEVSR
jgi:phosphopantothenoylcysteine decarboxylase / phosphopantothenate---cysteine ligase